MPKRPQNYHRPDNLQDALKHLTEPDSRPLGGGTRLLAGDVNATTVVDLQDLIELKGIAQSKTELTIGAMEKLATIETSEEISAPCNGILRAAIKRAGPNTFRNAATLGGIIGSREPRSELLALLLALDCSLEIVSTEGTGTTMPLNAYLEPDERPAGLITQITVPVENGQGAIERVARTPADAPIVAVAGWKMGNAGIRIAATGTASRPARLNAAENAGSTADRIAAAQDSVSHPGDFLGSAAYRREMAAVLLRRVLEQLR